MAKTLGPKGNFRVVITPRSMTDFGFVRTSTTFFYDADAKGRQRWEDDMYERCEDIANDVRRHADNVGSVSVEYDQEHVCQHCGSTWTEASNTYNGGCCAKDEESNPDVLQATGSAS